jgi:DNA primase
MGRIADEQLRRLKQQVAVQRLAEARGVVLKRHGADLIGLCPFHADHSPSLVISPAKNLWHCLGACQAGGSVIDWVMKAEGVSFRHAVELLREDNFSLAASAGSLPVKRSRATRLPVALDQDADDRILLGQVIDYYHETLKQSPEALAYLKKRGLNSSEMIDRFRLGFANRTLGYRLPKTVRKDGAAIRGRLQKLGILRKSGHEHLTGSLVIPVFDEQGRVCEVYGRKIRDDLRKGTPIHLYLPGPHKGVFNIDAFAAGRKIIICEALIDALTFWCAGFRNVTASFGVEGFTQDHLKAFKTYDTQRVLMAYDRDEAGEKAAGALAQKLIAEGITCYRINFPKGMDANEYALKVQPAVKSLQVVIRNAVWLGGVPAQQAQVSAMSVISDTSTEARSVAEYASAPALESNPAASGEVEPVSMTPPAPATHIPAQIKAEEVLICLGDRCYRIRGLAKNSSFDQLKVNILAVRKESFFVDTFDLYAARHRSGFIRQAAKELGVKEQVVKKDLGKVLFKLEQLQEEQIKKALAPQKKSATLTDSEKHQALELLKDPDLIGQILADFERCGVVGEETNKLIGYLAAVSRKLQEPLAVLLQSSSAAGKSMLMEAILAFMPEEDRVKYSAMTGQSLFYMGEKDLRQKILAIVEEEGAQRASYALKLLQSEGELTIASTGKDPASGRLVTHEYRVQGPVMVFVTTTHIDIDEEFLNRCLVLTINEDRAQTRTIHRLQRQSQTLKGLLASRNRTHTLKVHRNAQRLLRPVLVANPYSLQLSFPDSCIRTRRDHMKYLTLIRTIAFLHQYQWPVKTITEKGRQLSYIEVTLEDIKLANRLANEVLGRSLDELPPQTRRLLMRIDQMVTEACKRLEMERSDFRFSRRDVREYTGWGNTQLKVHLHRLEDMEYLLVHRGGRGQSYAYELLYRGEGQNGAPFLAGLADIDKLKKATAYDKNKSGFEADSSGVGRGRVGPGSGAGRDEKTVAKPHQTDIDAGLPEKELKRHDTGIKKMSGHTL